MKKCSSSYWKCVVTIMMVVFFQTQGITQNKTVSPQKTSGKQIVISIAGIEYDDAGLIKLRETGRQVTRIKRQPLRLGFAHEPKFTKIILL